MSSNNIQGELPILSIWVITYNHENSISKALDSILSLNISCSYEIVVSDDYSSDNTFEICKTYKEKYPDIIKVFRNKKNKGYEANFFETFSLCQSPYIAMLEGDDVWVSNRNIEKQIDFLKNNKEYSGICGNFIIKDEKDNTERIFHENLPWGTDILTVRDLLKVWTIHINTLVFRKSMLDLSKKDRELKCADIALVLFLAGKGPIKYEHEVMAIWHKHNKGFSNVLTKDMSTILRYKRIYLSFFNRLYDFKYAENIRKQNQWDYEDYYKKLKANVNFSTLYVLIKYYLLMNYYKMPLGLKSKIIYLFPKL